MHLEFPVQIAMRRYHPDLVIRLIALFKLVKAAALIALSAGAIALVRNHDGALGEWLDALVADPHGKYLHRMAARLGALDARRLEEIGVASLVYAAVFLVEGIGLMLRRPWAELLTVIITTSFIPLEIYELIGHKSPVKAIVVVMNVLVVVYLVLRLRREGHWPFR